MPSSSHWVWKLLTLAVMLSWSALVLGNPVARVAAGPLGLTVIAVMIAGQFQHAFGWPRLPHLWWRWVGLPLAAWVVVAGGRAIGWYAAMLVTGIHPHHGLGWIMTHALVTLFGLAAFPLPLVRLGQWQPLVDRMRTQWRARSEVSPAA